MLIVNSHLQVPLEEFTFHYTRSSGPGGQNVNKVNSKAVLRWPVVSSPSLPEPVRARFLSRYANRVSGEGDLVLTSERYRDQKRNVDDCLEKVREMLLSVAIAPVPRKKRKPSLGAKRRRLDDKRVRSQKKEGRQRPSTD